MTLRLTLASIRIRFTLIFIATIIYPLTIHAEEIVFVNGSSHYCPYSNCDTEKNGFIIDIVNAIYKAEGYNVQIQNFPWNRALAMVNDGRAMGIIGVVKKSAPKLIYPHTGVAQYDSAFIVLNSNPWHYEGVDSLNQIRLGLVQNYGYGEGSPAVEKYLATNHSNVSWIANSEPLLQIFRMIEAGHIDGTIEDTAVANYILEKAGKKNLFKFAGQLESGMVAAYIGFTPNDPNSQHLADLFDQGMVKLRKSGKLKTILAQYGLNDWNK